MLGLLQCTSVLETVASKWFPMVVQEASLLHNSKVFCYGFQALSLYEALTSCGVGSEHGVVS